MSKMYQYDQFASKYHLGGGAAFTNPPKQTGTFLVYFRVDDNAWNDVSTRSNSDDSNVRTFMVKSTQIPMPVYQQDVANEYNRKRIIQTKVEYPDITMTIYDDSNGSVLSMLEGYHRFYFGDAAFDHESVDYWNTPSFKSITNEFGFRGNKAELSQNEFFQNLNILWLHGTKQATMWTVFRPFIKSISSKTLDYESSEVNVFDVTFSFEGYVMSEPSQSQAEVIGGGARGAKHGPSMKGALETLKDTIQHLEVNNTTTESKGSGSFIDNVIDGVTDNLRNITVYGLSDLPGALTSSIGGGLASGIQGSIKSLGNVNFGNPLVNNITKNVAKAAAYKASSIVQAETYKAVSKVGSSSLVNKIKKVF